MESPAGRIFTPPRIIAVALIAIVVAGLAYLRLAPGSEAVSVPPGARAGDLILKSCHYETEKGSLAADCGTLVVPENRGNPQSRLIAVPVTRIRAQSERPVEPLFRFEGGPGVTNMEFKDASRFVENRDVVLVGYRGVDGSVRLDCPEVESALRHSNDVLGEESFRAYADGLSSCGRRYQGEGVDLAGYSFSEQIDDVEAARVALGYDRIDLVSESAGTRLAMIYAWRYPKSIHRSVMLGVNPPGNFFWYPQATDEQIGRYADLCAQDAGCSKRTDDLAATLRQTAADMPDHWLFLPIKKANARIVSFWGLFETTSKTAPGSSPLILDALLSARKGDTSGVWFGSVFGDLIFPTMFMWGEYAAIGGQDSWAVDAYYAAGGDHGSILGNPGSDFAWGGGRLGKAWPVSPDDAQYRQVRTSDVETLLIGGALDISTPPQNATKQLLPYLPNGHQVVLPGFGHTASIWGDQPEAGTRLITTFLDSGRVDDSLYRPASIDFTPGGMTLRVMAKGLLVIAVGLSLLTVLSLLGMVRWVSRRGRFGAKASVLLRSVYAIVLGLGGWLLGALVVLTALPAVRLDSQLLAVLATGVPSGLAIYLAWIHDEWTARSKITGLGVAIAGALLGAWLGHNATGGLMMLITTLLGATAFANLAIIALEITWELLGRTRPAAVELKPVGTHAAV